MKGAEVQIGTILLQGGMDQITPTLNLKPGLAREALNFECAVTGGYARIAGYERFDGHASPADNSAAFVVLVVAAIINAPVVGSIITSSGGAKGTAVYVSGTSIAVAQITGTFAVGETIATGTFTRASTATYIDSLGVLQEAAVNEMRWDYTGGVFRGLLMEAAATNVLTYSQDYSNAVWTAPLVTLDHNNIDAPDGTTTGCKVLEAAVDGLHHIYHAAYTPGATANYTFSVYVKAGLGRDWVCLRLDDGATLAIAFFNITTGTVGIVSPPLTGSTITAVTDGWYKLTVTRSLAAGTAFYALIVGATADTVYGDYLGDITKGFYIWGSQLEAGAAATSYIPTTTAAVTRAADVGAATTGVITNVATGPTTPLIAAQITAATADLYRASIAAVPGSGPVRGVIEFNDVVYAFRDDAAAPATYCAIYKSTTSGWAAVPFLKTVTFSAGTTKPAEGATLTQGGVTAVIKRVVLSTGAWSGTAAGQFIIDTLAGGNFAGGAATATGGTTVTLAAIQTAVTLPPGGRYEFDVWNFGGQAATQRVYGINGVGKAFEFDGTILVPISTGAASDIPTHVATHNNKLWLSIGSSVMYSSPGLPYDWTALGGAGEIATGDTVTAMVVMPGGTATPTLGITSRNNTGILYGSTTSDYNFVQYNTGSGAMPYSVQNMAQTLAFDDRGAIAIQAALQYGNFTQATLTNAILPFINSKINLLTASTLCRRKSQYRLFFSDGTGLYITIVNGKSIGCMPVYFTNPVTCAYEGKKSTGEDLIYFGSTDGMVYQMEKGTSFDGDAITYNLALVYTSLQSPRLLKRYRRASIELFSESNAYVTFDFSQSLGYDDAAYNQPVPVTPYKNLTSYLQNGRWDTVTWDQFFYDYKGSGPIDVQLEGTAENIAMVLSGTANYVAPFTINSILIHFTPRRLMR